MLKQIIQIFDLLIGRTSRRLTRATDAPARAQRGLLRAQFECLESRSLLSLAPADDAVGSKLDIGWLQKPDYSDISILPIRPIEDGARPWPPGYPSLPPPPFDPYLPPPPTGELPDDSDVGGFTEIDNSDKGDPGILVEPVSDKITREVQQMLDSLLYVPSARNTDASLVPERTSLRTQDAASAKVSVSLHQDDTPDGGMVALVHDSVIVHSVASDAPAYDDIDSWLSVPVRMDSVPGKFQAFEVSTGEPPPAPPPLPPVDEVLFLAPLKSTYEPAPAAAESKLHNSVSAESAAAIDQVLTDSTVDLSSSPAVPPEQSHKNSTTRPAAAAAVFVFLAVRAARAARTTDASEPHTQRAWILRRPAQPGR